MCNTSWNNCWSNCHNHTWSNPCDTTWNNSCDCDCDRPTTLTAQVLDVRCGALLVCDCETSQQVQVNTDDACSFEVGDRLCIQYNGAMTNSIPPQISATCIRRISSCSSNSCSSNSCSSNSCSCS